MAAWRDRLLDASFRGVAFKVDGHDHDFGRRGEVHEYPQRDKVWVEDLGLASRRFKVDAYVIGANYDQARDALVAAVETIGPAELVHPWLGRRFVSCVRSTLHEDTREAGQALFSLEFVEDSGNVAPTISPATQAAARTAASDAAAQTKADFASGFSVAGVPAFVLTEAGALNDLLAGKVESLTNLLAPIGGTLDAFRRQLASFRSNALGLVSAPAALASAAMGLVQQVRLVATTPAAALQALRPLLAFGSTLQAVLGGTPARGRQRLNQLTYVTMVRRAAAGEAVLAIADMTFDSYDAAAAVRDDIAGAIDVLATEAADAGADDAWRVLVDLNQSLVADVTARGGSLARLFSYRPTMTAPALVIAYSLYGDAGRESDLVARNRIRHPGFVTAGAALEALSPDLRAS